MLTRFVALALAALGLLWATAADGMDRQVPESLVFVRGGNVFRMFVDGSETVQLTATKVKETSPAVSPDSLGIAFGRGNDELWTMDTRGDDQRRVVDRRPKSVRYARTGSPSWSPDGRSLFFDRVSQTPNEICGSIFRVGVSAGVVKRVTAGLVRGSLDADPAVSPDGRRIVLVSGDCEPGCCPGIGVVDTAGRPTGDLRQLGRTPGAQLEPSWAPDGKSITFVVYDVDGSGRSAVYVVNRSGSGLRRITQWTFETGGPAWSPDGEWIAFQKEGGLFLIRPDGTGLQQVPGTQARDMSPAWLRRT
jgi:Tol biopolymer transport system component